MITPSVAPHISILASAGSGKTFRLSSRYLALIAAGARPATILATTFTRAAAGEIRDRILSRLAQACVDRPKREELIASLRSEIGDSRLDLGVPALRDLLGGLTRDLHALQVRTIDSFFAGIVRCFALSLDLPPNAAIVEGERQRMLTRDAIRMMLADGDPQRLIDLLREFIEGRADRGVTDVIERTVTGLHGLYREAPREAWDAIRHSPTLEPEPLARAIASLEAAGEAASYPDRRHRTALEKNLDQLRSCADARADDWAAFLDAGLAKPIARGDAVYCRKPIDPRLVDAYAPLIRHARAVVRNAIRSRTLATRDLLERYDAAALAARRAARAITFDDLTAAVASQADTMELADIYFRLDARIQHLLLDEMQDTSVEQWRALMPIAREVLATYDGSRTFFCVGDVKQSIYGWRDAAPDLLERLPDMFESVRSDSLEKSWRSSPVVIDAVNRVFTRVAANPVLADFTGAAEAWDGGFRTHQAVEKNRRLPGRVELRVCRAARDGEHPAAVRLREAAELVRDLHARAPMLSIGVLTRSNKAVGHLLNELTSMGVRATGRGGGPLTDAAPVNAVLDALRLAEHPAHTIALFHVANSPLWAVLGGEEQTRAEEPEDRKKAEHESGAAPRHAEGHAAEAPEKPHDHDATGGAALPSPARAAALSRHIRRLVMEHGLARTVARWVRHLAPSCDARELRRLHELVELASAHDAHPTPRLDDFVRVVETTAVADPMSARVEVMTIHKSKGLEFDLVILPDLDGRLIRTDNALVAVERPEPGGPVTRITRWVSEDQWGHFDDLRTLHESTKRRLARESLAVLYVAMTRAIGGLFMLIDGPVKRAPKCSHAALLMNALAPGRDREPGETLYESGDPGFLERLAEARAGRSAPVAGAAADALDGAEAVILLRPSRLASVATESPSKEAEADAAHAADDEPFRLSDAEALDAGTAMHAMFEQIEWIEDGVPDDGALRRAVSRALPRRATAWIDEQLIAFRAALENPNVRAVLSRNGGEPSAINDQPSAQPSGIGARGSEFVAAPPTRRVWRERRFIRDHDGAIQLGAIDRLDVTYDATGRCVGARITDFKTDAIESPRVVEHAARYRRQMLTYRAAAASVLGIDESAVDLQLVYVRSGIVLPVI